LASAKRERDSEVLNEGASGAIAIVEAAIDCVNWAHHSQAAHLADETPDPTVYGKKYASEKSSEASQRFRELLKQSQLIRLKLRMVGLDGCAEKVSEVEKAIEEMRVDLFYGEFGYRFEEPREVCVTALEEINDAVVQKYSELFGNGG
jgi:hypothetical protein